MKRIALAAFACFVFAAAPAMAQQAERLRETRQILIDPAAPLEPAPALPREAVVGVWATQFANRSGGPIEGVGVLRITLDSSPDGLDGVSPAPGWDGVQTGEVTHGPNDTLIWTGRWASIWPEGATMGTFRLVFANADTFTGTWSSDDGEIVDAAWNGRRLH